MDWKVSKASPACSVCGKDLGEEEFVSALKDNGIDFDRLDICLACWEEARREDLFSFWRTRHVREEKARPRVRYVDNSDGTPTTLRVYQGDILLLERVAEGDRFEEETIELDLAGAAPDRLEIESCDLELRDIDFAVGGHLRPE